MSNSSWPLVSIVTATKNREHLLEKLIKSIASQTYPAVEHIVIDGASSDGTKEMLAAYEKRYRLTWISETDRNQIEAINKGLRLAKGEYVSVTHDDDYWLEDGIRILMESGAGKKGVDIISGDSWELFPDGQMRRCYYRTYSMSEVINRGYQIPQHGAIFKRSWLNVVGFQDPNLEYVSELELFLRMMSHGARFEHVSELVGVTLRHADQKSWRGRKRSADETWEINRKYGASLFSLYTLLYLKNRYFSEVDLFLKRHLKNPYSWLKKIFKTPTYYTKEK